MAQIVALTVQLSIFLVVLSLGLRSSAADATYLFRSPGLLLRSLLAMNLVMPVVVALAAMLLPLHPAVKIALIALAVSPVPPFLPGKELKLVAADRERYVYGLLVASAVLAIVLVPLVISLLAAAAQRDVQVHPLTVARIVAITVLLPLSIGIALRQLWPAAVRLSAPVNAVGMVLLLLVAALIIVQSRSAIGSLVGDGTLLVIAAFTLVGLAVGHVLGGPAEDDRTVLALSTASRHPAVALAVANSAPSGEALAPAAIVLALVVSFIVAVPYTAWRKRLRGDAAAGAGARKRRSSNSPVS